MMERATPYSICEGVGETAEFISFGVDDARIFTNGDTVMVDDEIMTSLTIYDKPSVHPDGVTYGPFPYLENRFYNGTGGQPAGTYSRTMTLKGTKPANAIIKAVCVVSGGGSGNTFKNGNAFDYQALPNHWLPTDWKNDWRFHVADLAYGSWTATASDEWAVGVQYKDPDIVAGSDPRSIMNKDTMVVLKDCITLQYRGQLGTTAALHTQPTKVSKYYDIDLYVDEIEFFSQEEDIMLSDALRRVLRLAGGNVTEKYLVDVDAITTPHFVLGSDWRVIDIDDGKKDFIAEIDLPDDSACGQQVRIGVGFYGSIPLSVEFDEGYYLCITIRTYRCIKCLATR